MPLPEGIQDYRALLDHVERLHQAVSHERWSDVESLWFDHFALHKRLGPPTINDKQDAETIRDRMDEISKLLDARKQDIALLLRIAP